MTNSSNNVKFERSLDKSKIPVCNIMGVNIAVINMHWLLEYITRNIKHLTGDYLCVANVHTTVTAFDNQIYCSIQNNGIMAIPDGGPLSSVGRKRGYPLMQRTPGPDLMSEIFEISVSKAYRHFFYGSTDQTLTKLSKMLTERYPGIKIVGKYSPPFRLMTKDEDDSIVSKINQSTPDFIWVGLGAPKQEYWMAQHQGIVHGLMIGVGAGFDYLAGNINRAPLWMQRSNLEWLYRLIQEPRRLLCRYIISNSKFVWYALIKGK